MMISVLLECDGDMWWTYLMEEGYSGGYSFSFDRDCWHKFQTVCRHESLGEELVLYEELDTSRYQELKNLRIPEEFFLQ